MRIPGKPSAEDGFTFIETLACAFIMALVIGAIAPLVDASIRTLDRIAREERRAHRIALAYDAFHSACSRTCPPPWARMGTLVEKKGDELLIYYADGELDASWSLRIEEKSIEVDDGDVTVAFEADSARVHADHPRDLDNRPGTVLRCHGPQPGPGESISVRGGHDAGYASLVAIGAVFLATGLALAWAEPFLVRAREERALIAKWERAERLESTAIGLLTDLERETDGDARKMLAYQLPMNATLRDSGSLVALNWVRAFVLLDSPLRDVFKGGSPEELQSFRAREPLPTRLRDYDRFFDPSDSSTYFTIDAPMNINTVDEFAFASAISQMTGDASEGHDMEGKAPFTQARR